MMKRILCILLCLALPLSALGAVRMPEMRGNINDAADVLSASTVADLAEFSQLVMQETDLGLHVATVHFLDGMEAQIYAEQLFQKWELTDQDMLLVCAAGEDSFALCLGEYAEMQLGRSNADNLLYTSSEFGQLFSSQQYDAAMAAYAAGLNTLLEKQLGSSVRMKGLFGEQSLVSGDTLNVDEYLSKVHIPPWQDVLEAINEVGEEFQTHYYEAELEENGVTVGGWIVLVILAVILLRQNRRDRERRRAMHRRSGCGCSPVGWIIGLLGLGFLFNKE